MPKGFTEEEKEFVRQRLLKEGEKRFSAYGLKRTTIEDLARAAKISTGSFYLFYASKEALFMDVAELAELRFRREILAEVDLAGPSPRARLYAIFRKAFALLKTIPLLKLITGSDYDQLVRRMPPEKLQEHFVNDRLFFEELCTHCQDAGIPIQVQPEEIISLLYPLVLAVMHEGELDQTGFGSGIDLHLELITAFCLGEVELQYQESTGHTPATGGRTAP